MNMYVVLVVFLVSVFTSTQAEEEKAGEEQAGGEQAAEELRTPALEVSILNGTGFNISIPEAGKEMMDFRYFVSFNAEFKDAKELYCKGRVECFSPKSKFKLIRQREMQEGDTLYFYLIGYRKPENFQMERVYEVKKNEEGDLEFQEKTSRAALEKEGLWYDQLDKLQETKP